MAFSPEVLTDVNRDLPDGYTLRLNDSEPPLEPGWVILEAILPNGEVRQLASMADFEDFFSALRTAQGELIEHDFGKAWPVCPAHGTHPLVPNDDGWCCPMDADEVWSFGTLREIAVAPEPEREDGEVRWWADDLGWGVVADRGGDVWVLFVHIEGAGYRFLREGELVEFRLSGGMQGKFRQASSVRQRNR
jgi:cold shock protein